MQAAKAMLAAKKISTFLLKFGWWLLVLAPFPDEGFCQALPDAPQPQNTLPGRDIKSQSAGNGTNESPPVMNQQTPCLQNPPDKNSPKNCQAHPPSNTDPTSRFVTSGKGAPPLTPMGKLRLAGKDIINPFNLLTIGADSAIAIGSDSHSPYGPGLGGFGRYAGVALTGNVTAEFFGTFLVPSLAHQDPRYHRMPSASVPRRVGHTIIQVVWTKGDSGEDMPNYGTIFGLAAANVLGNLYVPGQDTDPKATATRWATGLATSPIDNILTEFLPDIAKHVNVRVVLFQRIMNSVAKPGSL
jgi:hypothetical protein